MAIDPKIQAYNEGLSRDFERPNPVPHALDVLRRWIGTGRRVLDVGCGAGFYGCLFSEWGNEVHGLDVSPSAVREAQRRGLTARIADVERPFPEDLGRFDRVTCVEVFEHLVSPEAALANIRNALEPDGRLILTVPNAAFWAHRLMMLFGRTVFVGEGRFPAWTDPHLRHFTLRALLSFLKQGGFEPIEVRGTFTGFPGTLRPYLPFPLDRTVGLIQRFTAGLDFLADRRPALAAAGFLVLARPKSEPAKPAAEPPAADPSSYYARYWDRSQGWTPDFELCGSMRVLLEEFCGGKPSLLDLGCGDGGHCADFIGPRVREYAGIDVSKAAVAEARRRGIDAAVGDLSDPLPFEDGRFDRILCLDVLEHLLEPSRLLSEARRALAPGGRLMASVPNPCYFRERLLLLAGWFNPRGSPETSFTAAWQDPHLRFFTRKALVRMLEAHGFEVLKIAGIGENLALDIPVLSRLLPRALGRLLSARMRFLAKLWPSLFASTLAAVCRAQKNRKF